MTKEESFSSKISIPELSASHPAQQLRRLSHPLFSYGGRSYRSRYRAITESAEEVRPHMMFPPKNRKTTLAICLRLSLESRWQVNFSNNIPDRLALGPDTERVPDLARPQSCHFCPHRWAKWRQSPPSSENSSSC